MQTETPTVNKPQAKPAPAKPDASMGTGNLVDEIMSLSIKPGESDVKATGAPSSAPQEPSTEPEPEPSQKGEPESVQEAAPVEQPEQEQLEPEALPEVEPTEPEPEPKLPADAKAKTKEAFDRLRASKDARISELQDKYQRLMAQAAMPPQSVVAPQAAPQAAPSAPSMPTEFSSQEWAAYYSDLSRKQANGETIAAEQLDYARHQYHRAIAREELRRELGEEMQRKQQVAIKQHILMQCQGLEQLDPRFALLDSDGKAVQSEFTKAVQGEFDIEAARMLAAGLQPSPADYLSVAKDVASKVLAGRVQLAETKSKQATTTVKQVLRQTGLGNVQRPAPPQVKPEAKAADLRYKAYRGDQAAIDRLVEQDLVSLNK